MPKIPAKSAAERLPGFGAAVQAEREKIGYTVAGLADLVGVGTPTVWKVEQGERIPSLPVAVRLASALGVTVDSLVARAAELAGE